MRDGSCLFIGQDRFGRWVAKDAQRLCGALFAKRAEATRFAMYECRRHPQSVIMLPNGLELDATHDFSSEIEPVSALATRAKAPQ